MLLKYVEALSYEEMPWLGDPNMPAVDVRLPELRGRDRSSMRMRGGFGVIVLAMSTLVALGPSAVRAQELRLVGRVPDAARVRVDSVLDRARAAGLPTEPIVDRALEGAAKGAPPDLIVRGHPAGGRAPRRARGIRGSGIVL